MCESIRSTGDRFRRLGPGFVVLSHVTCSKSSIVPEPYHPYSENRNNLCPDYLSDLI